MNHPFSLRLEDLEMLDFEIVDTEIEGGNAEITTLAIGEEGGSGCPTLPFPRNCWQPPRPRPIPICPPIYTTMAFGEEGGSIELNG